MTVLAVPAAQSQTSQTADWILFFRQEQVETLNWAGNPRKTYKTGPMGDRLTPRTSFALWKEDVRNRSLPWTEDVLETARTLRRTPCGVRGARRCPQALGPHSAFSPPHASSPSCTTPEAVTPHAAA